MFRHAVAVEAINTAVALNSSTGAGAAAETALPQKKFLALASSEALRRSGVIIIAGSRASKLEPLRDDPGSKISLFFLALHRGRCVAIYESALALGKTAAAQFSNDVFDGRRI
jgi:hypothetical protein